MNVTETKRKIVEKFLNHVFRNCNIEVEEREFKHDNGFFLKEKHYFLCNTKVLYQWERPDSFKVAFDNEFMIKLAKWVPLRGKKQFYRDWLFNEKFPDFEYKNLLENKFFYYKTKS